MFLVKDLTLLLVINKYKDIENIKEIIQKQLNLLKSKYDRAKDLYESNAISAQELETSTTSYLTSQQQEFLKVKTIKKLNFKIKQAENNIEKLNIEIIELNKDIKGGRLVSPIEGHLTDVFKIKNGYVRPVVWRGSEMMAISAQQTKIHVAIAAWEWGSYFDPKLKIEGIKLNISNWRRPAPNTIPWDTKASGLYMICTLSKHEAEKQGYTDSLMLDHEGNIAEATGANIFFKDKNGEIHTPIPDSFLDGITRRTVIGIAKSKNIKVHERKISPTELPNFVGCFLTGTAAEVTPVSCIAENQFKVCDTIIDLNESYQVLVRKKKAA